MPGYFSDRLRRTGRAPRNLTAGYILKKDTPTVGKKSNTGQEFKVYTDWTRRKSEPLFFVCFFFFFIIIFFYETVKRNNKTQNSAKTTSYVAFILSFIFIPIFAFFLMIENLFTHHTLFFFHTSTNLNAPLSNKWMIVAGGLLLFQPISDLLVVSPVEIWRQSVVCSKSIRSVVCTIQWLSNLHDVFFFQCGLSLRN